MPSIANFNTLYTLYKIKQDDNGNIRHKARIVPPENENVQDQVMEPDCFMCSPVGIRIFSTIVAMWHWPITNPELKCTFSYTGMANKFISIFRQIKRWTKLLDSLRCPIWICQCNWKISIASWRLSVWVGFISDECDSSTLFLKEIVNLVFVATKIGNDFLLAGSETQIKLFLSQPDNQLKFGIIISVPGFLKYYGFTIEQFDVCGSVFHADDELSTFEWFPLTRKHQKASNKKSKHIKK